MDYAALVERLTPYIVAIVVVASATELVARFVPYFKVAKGQKRTDKQKLAIDVLALLIGIGVGLSGRVSPDGDFFVKAGDGFIVAALAIKNRDVVVRAMRIGKKKGDAE